MGSPNVRLCKVVSVKDDCDGDRIKVRYIPEDLNITSIDNLPWCIPLIPKMVHIKPKVGEAVFVLNAQSDDGNTLRYYIGPVISQITHMEEEPYAYQATKFLKGPVAPDPAPSMDPTTKGAFPDETDVALLGRKNTQVRLTDTDARLEAGVRVSDETNNRKVTFNTTNPCYLKLKYHDKDQATPNGQTYRSTATIVADKINLIGNGAKDYFKTTDNEALISDEVMKDIIDKAHQLPYGDILIEFLTLFRNAFMQHVHPFSGLPPCVDPTVQKLQGYNLDKMLTDTVRIN